MVNLITASQCLKKLETDGIKYTKGYFSQMTSDGKIPWHPKSDSPKKFYIYEEVIQAIKNTQDPTRDAQREANEQKRAEPVDLFAAAGTYESVADMDDDEREAYDLECKREIDEARKAREAALAAGAKDTGDNEEKNLGSMKLNEVKIAKEYWLGEKAKAEVEQMKKVLIPKNEVAGVIEFMISPINTKLDEIPHKMRANFSDFPDKQYRWLIDHINHLKQELHNSGKELL
ncbi:MAG: hypothetical protein Q8M39_11300 [Sulfuricurvum sp.]|nr:hypothetical protein [Sulfuricurvum sp.]